MKMIFLSLFLSIFVIVGLADPIRLRFNPTVTQVKYEPDWANWTFVNGASSYTTTTNGVTATVSSSSTFTGGYWAIVYRKFEAYLGERVVAEGIATTDKNGVPLSLSIEGLTAGEHTLLSYHNSWDDITATSPISISVDGTTILSNITQTIRQDNVWTSGSSYLTFNVTSPSQKVTITYTPGSDSATDKRVFLNGFEIDTGNIKNQASFPFPERLNKHIDADSRDIIMSWKPPVSEESVTYALYLGNSADDLVKLYSGSETTFHLDGVDSLKTYYWRIDVTSPSTNKTTTGMAWVFRSRTLAFPGAEGHGKWARGGRGGAVIKVTSLADSGEGTLRWALLQHTGPRTVIFDVGGVINLTSRIQLSEWDREITIAGQTAPGKGIAVIGWPIGISSSADIVFQHMRVRPGKVSGQTVDGMGLRGGNHCIMDRCSMGWGIDESFSSRDSYNITFQRSSITEPLNVAGHANYPVGTEHGYAASIGGDIGSFHHNFIAHAEGRSWSLAGGVDANAYFQGRLDIRNNVVYNFGDRTTDGGAHQVNFVNNYYKPGPSSTRHYTLMAQYEDSLPGTQTYYCEGNMMLGYFNASAQQWVESPQDQSNPSVPCWPKVTINPAPSYQKNYDQPFFESMVTTHSATDAYKIVLSDSGASSPVRDDHDARIVNETLTNVVLYKGSVSGKAGIIDTEADVGGLEDFPTASRDTSWDTDGDGIPDWWDGSDGGAKGWTPMDGYLAFMSDPHWLIRPGSMLNLDLSSLAVGFAQPTFNISGVEYGTFTINGSTATYTTASSSGIEKLTLQIIDVEGSNWKRSIGIAIWEGA